MQDEITRPTIMEVDVKNFKYNIKQIKKYVNKDVTIMPIIKANGYGTYINKIPDLINKFDILGVATVDEAVELRYSGYKKDIFILNQPYIMELSKIIDNDLIIGISSFEFLSELKKLKKQVKVHIEIDTGMGRTGVLLNKLNDFITEIKECKNIKVEGVYTHLSKADTDYKYTKKQLDDFEKAVNYIISSLGNIRYIHASASNGIINFPNKIFNLIRPGIIIYGYESFLGIDKKIKLKPVSKLKSKITYLKEVEENTYIGYSKTFVTKRKSVIATVPIGYADGLKRTLSNKGYVVINGKKAPIIGNICMDSIMIDVTDIKNVKINDDVFIWDNKIIKLEDISNMCNTINYEIISTITSRVPRKFINL